jgi:hypothetical protein
MGDGQLKSPKPRPHLLYDTRDPGDDAFPPFDPRNFGMCIGKGTGNVLGGFTNYGDAPNCRKVTLAGRSKAALVETRRKI